MRVFARSLPLVLLAAASFLAGKLSVPAHPELPQKVDLLSRSLEAMRRQQLMPTQVLSRHRQSICFIRGSYSFAASPRAPAWRGTRTRFSGTAFVVAQGWLATNRHVAEPWFEDPEAEDLKRRGAQPRIEYLRAYCPGMAEPFALTAGPVSAQADVGLASYDAERLSQRLQPLPLAGEKPVPGEPVIVVGYPLGVTAMVAKSPPPVYRRLSHQEDDNSVVSELAARSLIRPSVTHGHLGDVVGNTLIYDAATAHGGSGGPVFDSHGQVIAINAAYLDGFSGGSLGISVEALRQLLDQASEANN